MSHFENHQIKLTQKWELLFYCQKYSQIPLSPEDVDGTCEKSSAIPLSHFLFSFLSNGNIRSLTINIQTNRKNYNHIVNLDPAPNWVSILGNCFHTKPTKPEDLSQHSDQKSEISFIGCSIAKFDSCGISKLTSQPCLDSKRLRAKEMVKHLELRFVTSHKTIDYASISQAFALRSDIPFQSKIPSQQLQEAVIEKPTILEEPKISQSSSSMPQLLCKIAQISPANEKKTSDKTLGKFVTPPRPTGKSSHWRFLQECFPLSEEIKTEISSSPIKPRLPDKRRHLLGANFAAQKEDPVDSAEEEKETSKDCEELDTKAKHNEDRAPSLLSLLSDGIEEDQEDSLDSMEKSRYQLVSWILEKGMDKVLFDQE
ncbi:hypothetical protein ADUPG1_008020 [Aduncisulcus paluster]|uniref:Uncharacterized protein n=1 Tax=Aduncisulcus paluster TaxID=2918883 RepID=A0ABQ5KUL6_9EUKA|nr:hypothetical protein ADUPG1_008020 [Aduncisulcus paluster]